MTNIIQFAAVQDKCAPKEKHNHDGLDVEQREAFMNFLTHNLERLRLRIEDLNNIYSDISDAGIAENG